MMYRIVKLILLLLLYLPCAAQHWTCLGPNSRPIDKGGAGTLSGIGMVTAIDFSKQDSNRVFLGAANGGVWLFDIKRDTSIPLGFDTVAHVIDIAALVVDPLNDNNIYVANGDKLGPFDWGDNIGSTNGIYYTRNMGITWQRSRFYNADNIPFNFDFAPYNYHRIPKIIINPLNPKTLFCVEHDLPWDGNPPASRGHIYVSHDGGVSWHQLQSNVFTDGYFNDILFDPSDTSVIFAASHSLYRSIDGGNVWQNVTANLNGYSPETNPISRICLSSTPAYDSVLSIGILTLSAESADKHHLYLLKTIRKKNIQTANLLDSAVYPVKCANLNAPEYHLKFKYGICLSGMGNTVYAYGTLFQASYNKGITFTNYGYAQQMHPDIHCTAVSPHASQSHYVFAGTDGGLYISRNNGKSFTPHLKGFATTMFYSVSVSDNNKRVLGGSQDNGTLLYDRNKGWSRINGGGDGNNVLFNPNTVDTFLYGDFQGDEVFLTRNGGNDFNDFSIPGTHTIPTPMAFEPGHPLTFYTGTNDVWKITKGRGSPERISRFSKLDSAVYDPNNKVTCIATTPLDSNTIYATLQGQWQDSRGHVTGKTSDIRWTDTAGYSLHQVYVTQNGGKRWYDITPQLHGGLGDVTSIAISTRNKKTIWVTRDRWLNNNGNNINVYMSCDGGAQWEPYYEGLPAVPTHKIICTPGDVLYVATNEGIYMRSPRLTQWVNISYNLPHTWLRDICYNRHNKTLYVATWGRGIWELKR